MARKRKRKLEKPTQDQADEIRRRLQKQYPQMFESVEVEGNKPKLDQAKGLDRKALEKMVAKRLKKVYRSK